MAGRVRRVPKSRVSSRIGSEGVRNVEGRVGSGRVGSVGLGRVARFLNLAGRIGSL